MFKKLIVSLGVVAAGLVLAPAASAVTVLTLESDVTTDKYKQQVNSPCIFGHSCSNGGFPMTDISSPDDSYDVYSPSYDASQIVAVAGSTAFIVAIDINTAGPEGAPGWGADEDLYLFEMCVGGADSAGGYDLSGTGTDGDADALPGAAGDWCDGGEIVAHYLTHTDMNDFKHGNGESDALLVGFDLILYDGGSIMTCGDGTELCGEVNVQFRAIMANTSNGFETFFIVGAESTPIPVPEPGVLGLLGAGLLGIGFASRRRRKKQA